MLRYMNLLDSSKRQVLKLDGRLEEFLPEKIAQSIWKAAQKVGGKDKKLSIILGERVLVVIKTKYKDGLTIKTSEIGEIVEKVLIEKGHAKTAQEFIRYRENKKHFIQDKKSLGVKDDIGFSYNSLYILKRRYLKRNEKGEIIETPKGMLKRVAKFLADVEEGKVKKKKWYKKFYEIMENLEFTPGTRVLANSGKKTPQLGNCFVWPIEDDINSIFEIFLQSTLIKK